jgi:hypothetical protein
MNTDMDKNRGKKINTDNPKFRKTDIFNTKANTETIQIVDKKTVIAVSEKLIDAKMRVTI